MKPRLILLPAIALTAGLSAQALRVTSSSSQEAANPEIVISFEAGEKKAPVALQFEVLISARPNVSAEWSYAVSSALKSAGKTAQCAGHWKKAPVEYAYACVITGGISEIVSGPIFSATFTHPRQGRSGKIVIDGAQAVDAGGGHYAIKKSEWVRP